MKTFNQFINEGEISNYDLNVNFQEDIRVDFETITPDNDNDGLDWEILEEEYKDIPCVCTPEEYPQDAIDGREFYFQGSGKPEISVYEIEMPIPESHKTKYFILVNLFDKRFKRAFDDVVLSIAKQFNGNCIDSRAQRSKWNNL